VTDAQGAVYVYGVLRAAEQESAAATGVTGASVRTIEHGELAALVSDGEKREQRGKTDKQ